MKVVLTGFGKFGDVADNPSTHLACALGSDVHVIASKVLQVSIQGVQEGILELENEVKAAGVDPDEVVWVHVGVYAKMTQIRIECRGFNEATFGLPDERGNTPNKEKVVEEDVQERWTTIDGDRLASDLAKEGHPFVATADPGRFICNYTLYHSLHKHKHAIFVHIPLFENIPQAVQKESLEALFKRIGNYIIADCKPEEEKMQALCAMGFPSNRVQKAFTCVGDNLEEMLQWILEHADDQDIDIPLETCDQVRALKACGVREQLKLVFAVSMDLKMTTGKIAAQVAHACLAMYRGLIHSNPGLLQEWETMGEPKIVCKIDNIEEIMKLCASAKLKNIPSFMIQDAGRTQVAPGSVTVVAIGPERASIIDQVTGHLKLL
mmetsp:Transcript_5694/g.8859  ORF Transcript_5694/g.8859 Transcript_5694/m.8859 type:complete len:379 (+) Transcript_5694:425-1561(+)|eukprot:CAMPEP_0203775918 /NCGR_PEP_ID=MMETSP0099_2-20121227/6412_1 /ASSEMBLY_ACC=CAM_ASM_000209 /TAXON_ID=96639 /ORGANISM=" , Strain NY0313808BC1" /LENGTH=378 /DNA_ID=CAMNT_0050674777 /DNA_START=514 /DNA_END=1650 /DNA_ORIENTATION=-